MQVNGKHSKDSCFLWNKKKAEKFCSGTRNASSFFFKCFRTNHVCFFFVCETKRNENLKNMNGCSSQVEHLYNLFLIIIHSVARKSVPESSQILFNTPNYVENLQKWFQTFWRHCILLLYVVEQCNSVKQSIFKTWYHVNH